VTLRYLLDTSTISAVIAPKPNRSVIVRLARKEAECAIAAPVWNELVYGYELLAPGKRKSVLEAFLRDVVLKLFPVLPYDQNAAAWHALERARLERAERPTPLVDGELAAIASVHGLILVTAHPRDFASFKDLRVENWTRTRAR
jgi:tRNA(fMet)-specific endonuclease VapC